MGSSIGHSRATGPVSFWLRSIFPPAQNLTEAADRYPGVGVPLAHSPAGCMQGRPLLALMLDDLIQHPWFPNLASLEALKQPSPSHSRWMDIASQHDMTSPGNAASLTGPETTLASAVSPPQELCSATHSSDKTREYRYPARSRRVMNRKVACAYIVP